MANKFERGSSGSSVPVESLPQPFSITAERVSQLGDAITALRQRARRASGEGRTAFHDPQERQREVIQPSSKTSTIK